MKKSDEVRYARLPHSVLHDATISVYAKAVYAELSSCVFQGNVASIGQRLIANRLGIAPGSANKAIAELVAAGHITASGIGKERKQYVLHSQLFARKQANGKTVLVSMPNGARRMVAVSNRATPPRTL